MNILNGGTVVGWSTRSLDTTSSDALISYTQGAGRIVHSKRTRLIT